VLLPVSQIDEKYSSRAAKMYRHHLARLLSGEESGHTTRADAEADSDDRHPTPSASPTDAPLASEFTTSAQTLATAASWAAQVRVARARSCACVCVRRTLQTFQSLR
jgi:hypothetical protein